LAIQRGGAGQAARTSLVAAHAVGNDPGGALDGLGSGLAIGLLGTTDLGRSVAVGSLVTWARSCRWIAGDETSRIGGALVLSAALRGARHTLALAVTGRGGSIGLAVGAAAALCTNVIGADLAASTISVTGTIIATFVGRGLVGTGFVGICARPDRRACAVVLAGKGVRTSLTTATSLVAANTVDTVSAGARVVARA
jgi:hypothetical protein